MDRNIQKISETDKNRQKPAETGRIGQGGGKIPQKIVFDCVTSCHGQCNLKIEYA